MEQRRHSAKTHAFQKEDKLSMRAKCELLSFNRSSLYLKPREKISPDDITILNDMRDLYEKRPFLGYRRLGYFLRKLGHIINNKKVLRLMRLIQIQAIYPRKNLSKRCMADKVHPYLLHDNPPVYANDVWQIDITYIRMQRGFVYILGEVQDEGLFQLMDRFCSL